MSFNTLKVQRRKWTDEEKKSTLLSCGYKCARCGKKLNMKTLTMEHVIPISKNGENVADNLVVLCQSCNSRKADKFCWSSGYYMAIENSDKLRRIGDYTDAWVTANMDIDTIKEYPLIAEKMSFSVDVTSRHTKQFVPALTLDIVELNLVTIKPFLTKFGISVADVVDTVPNKDELYSVYGIQSYDGNSCYGLFTIQVIDDTIYINEVNAVSTFNSIAVPMVALEHMPYIWKKFGIYDTFVRSRSTKSTMEIFNRFMHGGARTDIKGTFDIGDKVITDYDWFDKDCIFAFRASYVSDKNKNT